MSFGVLLVWLAFETTGCAMFRPSPLAEAQKSALEERERLGRATPIEEKTLDPEERVEEGDRFRAQGRSDQAMLSYLAAVRMDPAASTAKERIGFIHLASDVDRAESIFVRLVEEDVTNASAWRGLGLARMAQADFSGAKEALERAIELDPDTVGGRYALASVLGLMGRPMQALGHALYARDLRPNDAHVTNVVGMTRLLLGQHKLAEESFEKAIRLSPQLPSLTNNLGLALGLQGRFDEAYRVFRKTGDEQTALNNLGYVFFLCERYEQAIAHYERALAEPGAEDVLILKNLNAAISAQERVRGGRPLRARTDLQPGSSPITDDTLSVSHIGHLNGERRLGE
jgi:Flp pilus assembly protein TadD